MYRELIPRLANDYRVIAPDLPGFGFTEVPAERKYAYSALIQSNFQLRVNFHPLDCNGDFSG
jgi:pimeloyl-ACP methyl ester carboxylesterase